MKRVEIPGGWYCDALPDGTFAALITDRQIETHAGAIPLPASQNVLQLRLSPHGHIAGIGHRDDQAWLWNGAGWSPQGLAFGPRSVIFDAAGTLHRVPGPGHPAGSIGYRYVADDGRLVFSWETFADPARGLFEYTERQGITIGQAGSGPLGEDPCIARLPDGTYRLIDSGTCRFINVTRDGDTLAIAFVREDARKAVMLWMTVAELEQLPRFVPSQQAPPPAPAPQPAPNPPAPPDAAQPIAAVPDYGAAVRSFLAPRLLRYTGDPERTRAHSFEVLNLCCQQLHRRDPRVGLLEKTGGARVRDRAADILAYDLGNQTCQLFDVIGDSEGDQRMPSGGWSRVPEHEAGIRPIAQWKPPYRSLRG